MKRAVTVSLLTEPSIFILRFLRACLFALLLEKDSYRNIKIARGKEGVGHSQFAALLSGLSTQLSRKLGSKENQHKLPSGNREQRR